MINQLLNPPLESNFNQYAEPLFRHLRNFSPLWFVHNSLVNHPQPSKFLSADSNPKGTVPISNTQHSSPQHSVSTLAPGGQTPCHQAVLTIWVFSRFFLALKTLPFLHLSEFPLQCHPVLTQSQLPHILITLIPISISNSRSISSTSNQG